MKKTAPIFLFSLLVQLALSGGAFCQSTFGTNISARLVEELNSESTSNITSAKLIVANDLYMNNQVYIEKGTEILNSVSVTKRRGVGKPGIIEITAISTTDITGNSLPVSGTYLIEGKSNKAKALGVGLGVGLGTILLPMLAYIAKKGEPAVVKANTLINEFFIAE